MNYQPTIIVTLSDYGGTMKKSEITTKTRDKLIDSFWTIYCEKGIHKTTVGAVTKSAGYNRGTFYEYFTDIYDLLEKLEEKLLEDLKVQIAQQFKWGLPKSFADFSNTFSYVFSLYGDKLYVLLSAQGDPHFAAKLQKELRPTLLSITGLSKDDPYLDYLTAFGFSAMLGLVGHWYENKKEMSIEELFRLLQTLVATGILGYTGKKPFEEK